VPRPIRYRRDLADATLAASAAPLAHLAASPRRRVPPDLFTVACVVARQLEMPSASLRTTARLEDLAGARLLT